MYFAPLHFSNHLVIKSPLAESPALGGASNLYASTIPRHKKQKEFTI